MGMSGAIKMALGRCWRWSGSPLVVLTAVAALVWQMGYLAKSIESHRSDCGALWVWKSLTGYSFQTWSACDVRMDIFVVDKQEDHIRVRRSDGSDDLRLPNLVIWENGSVKRSGLWALTTTRVSFHPNMTYYKLGVIDANGAVLADEFTYPPESEILLALQKAAPVYQQTVWDYHPTVYRAMLSGKLNYTEPIYAGYAHNALALFLLGMTGRGVFGSRRWWRAFKARFRLKKNCCVTCGYGLEGLVTPRCPECGEEYSEETGQQGRCRDQMPVSGV